MNTSKCNNLYLSEDVDDDRSLIFEQGSVSCIPHLVDTCCQSRTPHLGENGVASVYPSVSLQDSCGRTHNFPHSQPLSNLIPHALGYRAPEENVANRFISHLTQDTLFIINVALTILCQEFTMSKKP